MRKLFIMLFVLTICGQSFGADFSRWWSTIRRYMVVSKTNVVCTNSFVTVTQDAHNVWIMIDPAIGNSTNAWNWIQANTNSINYMYSRTSLLDQAVIDSSGWTNWFATNTYDARISALEGQTDIWNQTSADATSWTNWFATNTVLPYVQAHTSEWDNAHNWLLAGTTFNHSWIDNDGITNQVNYDHGVVTNVYTNGVSIIP